MNLLNLKLKHIIGDVVWVRNEHTEIPSAFRGTINQIQLVIENDHNGVQVVREYYRIHTNLYKVSDLFQTAEQAIAE